MAAHLVGPGGEVEVNNDTGTPLRVDVVTAPPVMVGTVDQGAAGLDPWLVELDAMSLAALETVNVVGPLTDAELRASDVQVDSEALHIRTAMTPKEYTAVTTDDVLIVVGVTKRLRLFLVTVHEHPDASGHPTVTLKIGSTEIRREFFEASFYLPFAGPFEGAAGEDLTFSTTTTDRLVVNASYELFDA